MVDLGKIHYPSTTEQPPEPPEEQIREAMVYSGLNPPDNIIIDGKIHKFNPTPGGKASDKRAFYKIYPDGLIAGLYGLFGGGGFLKCWHMDIGRDLTASERQQYDDVRIESQKIAAEQKQKSQNVAAKVSSDIWNKAPVAPPDHPYLVKKGIAPHGARAVGEGRLVVPFYDNDDNLTSLQYITGEGDKKYQHGGDIKGKYWVIGDLNDPGIIYMAEGFATAATIHEAAGRPCVVAYSAGALPPVLKNIRERIGPERDVIIVADNDESGVGQNYADQAAAKYGARTIMPPIKGDANDFAKAGHDLLALLTPPTGHAAVEKVQLVFSDSFSDEFAPIDELVQNLLVNGSISVLYGDSNSGKTFLALSLAAAIATGQPFHGKQVDPGLVIYLATEAPANIKSRIQAMKKYHGYNFENIAFVPVPLNFHQSDEDCSDVIEAAKAIELEKGRPVRLIICDTLARQAAGASENSGQDMAPVMARYDKLALHTGAHVMIIHHSGKDQARGARGWSGIRAHVDSELEVIEKAGIRSVTVAKQRELSKSENKLYFKLATIEMGISKFGEVATQAVAIVDEDATADPPKVIKKDTKLQDAKKLFEGAWWATGKEEFNGLPYISSQGYKNFLITKKDYSESTAKNHTKPSRESGPLFLLKNGNIIECAADGWVIVDKVAAANMLLRKNSEPYDGTS